MKHSAPLTRELESRLRAYALAAGATGIGVLVLAQPSQAEVVYTPANVTITNQGTGYLLDLTGAGVKDFFIEGAGSRTALYVIGLDGNRVFGIESFGSSACYASALEAGRIIGQRNGECIQSYAFVSAYRGGGGRWRDVKDRYLGFQFKIGPRTHYGWARLSVYVNGNIVTARLTGYAYQTAPDKPIHAGQTEGTDAADTAKPEDADSDAVTILEIPATNSLGALALGSSH